MADTIDDLFKFLDGYGRGTRKKLVLFRGQSCGDPLLPKIARKNPKNNTTLIEKKMVEELRRVGSGFLPIPEEDDWDLLARAQHFGLATRLLDWTSNPLAALWFACCDRDPNTDGFLYFFTPSKDSVLSKSKDKGPYQAGHTIVYRPRLNSPRIIAQAGWFTLHRYSRRSRAFIALDANRNQKDKIEKLVVPAKKKKYFLEYLDQLGVNYQSMFPDLEGVCRHLNWMYKVEKISKKSQHPTEASRPG